MKRLVFILCLFVTSVSYAATYYVRNGGDDYAAGTTEGTAWASITKVNSMISSLSPGDNVLFRRGDTFYGAISISSKNGTSGNPITFGAYGTGPRPIITGMTTLTGWTNHAGNVYVATVTGASGLTTMVLLDGNEIGMGRWPDAGTNRSYTDITSNTIYDSSLGNDPNWTGAEVVISKYDWQIHRCLITNHNNGTLTFTDLTLPGSTGWANRYYFIQNDLRCVTTQDEWFHDVNNNRFYIYGNPTGKAVEISTIDQILVNNGGNYIHFVDLHLRGGNTNSIYLYNSPTDNRIDNCIIEHCGGTAIRCNTGGTRMIVTNTEIRNCFNGARIGGNDMEIYDNYIHDIGLIDGSGYMFNSSGLHISGQDVEVHHNRIIRVGYCGIGITSTCCYNIHHNFISQACLSQGDGGGVYTTAYMSNVRRINDNIVLNSGVGAMPTVRMARGIYLDEEATNVEVRRNVVAGCTETGFHFHHVNNNNITNNLSYNNSRQAWFQRRGTESVTGNIFTNNMLIAGSGQQTLRASAYLADQVPNLGTFDYNYYARPPDDGGAHIYYASTSTTLSGWQTISGMDSHTQGSPVSVADSDMHFIYNETNNPKYFRVTPGGASSKTLGTTDVLAQTSASNNRRAVVVTFPESGTIESISLCHAGGTGGVIMGIYADDGGVPGELLGTTGIVAVNAVSGWQTEQLVSPINVTQGQSVWIAWIFQNNVGMRYVGGSPDRAQAPAVWSEGLPNPFGTASMAAYRYSAYCTYSAVSSGSVVDVTGQSYSGVIELDPWTALVLLGGATVSEITGPSIEGRFYKNDDGVLLRSDGGTLLKIK